MWIGSQLLSLRRLPNSVIALCVSIIMAGVTEVMSNVATTTLFLPVLAEMVRHTHTHTHTANYHILPISGC